MVYLYMSVQASVTGTVLPVTPRNHDSLVWSEVWSSKALSPSNPHGYFCFGSLGEQTPLLRQVDGIVLLQSGSNDGLMNPTQGGEVGSN